MFATHCLSCNAKIHIHAFITFRLAHPTPFFMLSPPLTSKTTACSELIYHYIFYCLVCRLQTGSFHDVKGFWSLWFASVGGSGHKVVLYQPACLQEGLFLCVGLLLYVWVCLSQHLLVDIDAMCCRSDCLVPTCVLSWGQACTIFNLSQRSNTGDWTWISWV